jgi:hypothetical protein
LLNPDFALKEISTCQAGKSMVKKINGWEALKMRFNADGNYPLSCGFSGLLYPDLFNMREVNR